MTDESGLIAGSFFVIVYERSEGMGRNTCDKCGGKGFVSLGKGIRGVKKCVACRGKGDVK